MPPYAVAFHHATPHGVLSAVEIPDSPEAVPEDVLKRLPRIEANHASTLRGYRQVQFVGGRLALRRACEQLGISPAPLLSNDRGAPILPDGVVGSVSHKNTLAVGMVAVAGQGSLGIDIEDYGPKRLSIASAVLTPRELESIHDLDDERRWIAILLRFSIKESIYKALDPYVRRYVGFHEAEVMPDLYGRARVNLMLAGDEGPFDVDARYAWLHNRILTTVRIQRA